MARTLPPTRTPMSNSRSVLLALLSAALLSACSERHAAPPLAPAAPRTPAPVAALTAPGSCTITWQLGVSGDWSDSTRWAPSRLPTNSDTVCFSAGGVYTVTTDSESAAALLVDDNVWVTIAAPVHDNLSVSELEIRRLGRLTITQCLSLRGWGDSRVDGTLELLDGAGCAYNHSFRYLFITGMLVMQDAEVELEQYLVMTGELQLQGLNRLDAIFTTLALEGGGVTGAGTLQVRGVGNEVEWTGTALPARSPANQQAALDLQAERITLPAGGASGALDISLGAGDDGPLEITGDLIAGVDLGVRSGGDARWARSTTVSDQRRVTVHGTLLLHPAGRALRLQTDTLAVPGRITVRGDSSWVNALRVEVDGRLELERPLRLAAAYNFAIPTLSQHLVRGDILTTGGGELIVGERAWLEVTGNTTHRGRLMLQAGTLTGGGILDTVHVRGGTVSPGAGSASLAGFDVAALRLDAASQLELDVVGTAVGEFDRIVARRLLELDGTLDIDHIGFSGGLCGQRFQPLSLAPAAQLTGGFASLAGMPITATRSWRAVATSGGVTVAGYDPSVLLGVAPLVTAVDEGGAAAAAHACLGGPRPVASVQVVPVSRGGQVTLTPAALTFDTSNWALPQPFTLTAIDDTRAEGPHMDSVAFVLSSADPRYRGASVTRLAVTVGDNDPAVDLALALVAIDSIATVNEQLDVRFRVTNNGPGASTGSTFTITPMAGLEYVSNSAGISCTAAAGVLTCTVGALASGASSEFVILFRATAAGVHANTGRIAGRDYDPGTGDNSLTWRVIIS